MHGMCDCLWGRLDVMTHQGPSCCCAEMLCHLLKRRAQQGRQLGCNFQNIQCTARSVSEGAE